MLVPHNTHILVVDGAHMQILRNRGQAASLDLKVIHAQSQSNPASHVLKDDAPGRTHESVGPSGHAYETSDPHQQREDSFAAAALAQLQSTAAPEDSLIIIAPPKTLGHLRTLFDHALRCRIVGEINKDLAHRPSDEIALFLRTHQE